MEKEENQNSNSVDQNQDTVKETEKPEENLAKEKKVRNLNRLKSSKFLKLK